MTDQDLLNGIQYNLVEPPNGGASFPSGLWFRDEVIATINTRQKKLLRDTHLLTQRVEQAVGASTDPVTLPTDLIATLQLVWRVTATGARSILTPSDAFEADLLVPTWQTVPATPIVYLDFDADTLTLRLAPIPDVAGTLEILYVAAPTAATGANRTLSLPDEFCDGVEWGVLADLLGKVGRGGDPQRAQYCSDRFDLCEIVTDIILGGWA
jgi:hypothetical protein